MSKKQKKQPPNRKDIQEALEAAEMILEEYNKTKAMQFEELYEQRRNDEAAELLVESKEEEQENKKDG